MRESAETETILFAVDHHGREHALPAHDGWRVMEVIRDWGVEVAAECGSAGLCAPEGP
jgi:2Fe-2S ferredoxin